MSATHCAFLWLALHCLPLCCHGIYDISTLYLNNETHCNHAPFNVTEAHIYKVKADEEPDNNSSSFIECTMTFKGDFSGPGSNGRLCLVQEKPLIDVSERGVVLRATDVAQNHNMFSVDENNRFWNTPEYCTGLNTTHLMVSLRLTSKSQSFHDREALAKDVDIKRITVNLKVLLMSSRKRCLVMAYDDCENTFSLDHSEVSVYNMRKPEDVKVPAFILKKRCQITFKRESSADRSICVVYLPHGTPDCGSDWKLLVLRQRNSLDASEILYDLVCGTDPMSGRPHAWCAPYDLDQITLVHWRQKYVWSNESVAEQPEMYRLVVTDFPGNDTDLVLNHTLKWLAFEAKEEDSGGGSDGGGGGGGNGGDGVGGSSGAVSDGAENNPSAASAIGNFKGDSSQSPDQWFAISVSALIVVLCAVVASSVFISKKRERAEAQSKAKPQSYVGDVEYEFEARVTESGSVVL